MASGARRAPKAESPARRARTPARARASRRTAARPPARAPSRQRPASRPTTPTRQRPTQAARPPRPYRSPTAHAVARAEPKADRAEARRASAPIQPPPAEHRFTRAREHHKTLVPCISPTMVSLSTAPRIGGLAGGPPTVAFRLNCDNQNGDSAADVSHPLHLLRRCRTRYRMCARRPPQPAREPPHRAEKPSLTPKTHRPKVTRGGRGTRLLAPPTRRPPRSSR